jgi:DnaJ-class molecular chaperone
MKTKKQNKVPDYIPYQLCPKCNGQGTVSKPPYIPGDVTNWSSTSATFQCDVCNGQKIILMAKL